MTPKKATEANGTARRTVVVLRLFLLHEVRVVVVGAQLPPQINQCVLIGEEREGADETEVALTGRRPSAIEAIGDEDIVVDHCQKTVVASEALL